MHLKITEAITQRNILSSQTNKYVENTMQCINTHVSINFFL